MTNRLHEVREAMRRIAAAVGACAAALALCGAAAAQTTHPEPITLPQARFATGDDPARAQPDFDDRAWKLIDTTRTWEAQGFDGYDGYAWYRIRVVIPSSWQGSGDWPELLRLALSAIDDTDETFLNGVRIGKTGRMPGDPGGYDGRWDVLRDYLVDLKAGIVRWDRENVIAVRVYDAGGGGGFYKGLPAIALAQREEGVQIDTGQARHRLLSGARVQTTLDVANRYPVPQRGELQVEVLDSASGRTLLRQKHNLALGPGKSMQLQWVAPARPGIQARVRFVDARSGRSVQALHGLPYRLTPPDAPTPSIHGARLLGALPGSPLHYRVPASGRAPLRYTAQGLPAGLSLNAHSGVISGTVPAAGAYKVSLSVSNTLGRATRTWTLVAGEQLALTPPMGWNSWNAYGANVSDELVRKSAQALVDTGLAAKGWRFINIDDGWEAEQRRPDGEIEGNARFPDMAALGRYLHSLGLGFGIYSSPGPTTCANYLGSMGHERQDVATYARWGVDYLKYDLCSYGGQMSKQPTLEEHMKPYRLMGQILREQPRSIVYSLCQYGKQEVWRWGADVGGHAWRMSDDVFDTWQGVLDAVAVMAPHTALSGPGRWNDPDMLVVGHVGWGEPRPTRLTPDEQYSQVSLWSLLAAPLLLGSEMSQLDDFTLGLLTNHEVIAINQDALGKGAQRVLDRDGWQVWVKELEGGAKAVGVLNLGDRYRRLTLDPALFGRGGKAGSRRFQVRDAWRQRSMGTHAGPFSVAAPAHGVVLLTIR